MKNHFPNSAENAIFLTMMGVSCIKSAFFVEALHG